MNLWGFYFLSKFALHCFDKISMHAFNNFLLAVLVFIPFKTKILKIIRNLLGLFFSICLLTNEINSFVVFDFQKLIVIINDFGLSYIFELIQRLLDFKFLFYFICAFLVYILISWRLRTSTLSFVVIIIVAIWPMMHFDKKQVNNFENSKNSQSLSSDRDYLVSNEFKNPDEFIRNFFFNESKRKINLGIGKNPNFDILLLQVCSLSWDDMDYVNFSNHPVIKESSIIFTDFNTATSYSGPASIRLLQGNCGQKKHQALYEGVDEQCFVFPALEKLGYETQALLNHDGRFDGFADELQVRGGLNGKLASNKNAIASMKSFDNSIIYNDYSTLSQWYQARLQRQTDLQPVALYYNSISLHDGVHLLGQKAGSSLKSYKPRLEQLFNDFSKFIGDVEKGGRLTVIIMVPEHGANLRGDSMQIPGMREIPSPSITLGPAVVKIVNGPQGNFGHVRIEKTSSYFDLFTLLDALLKHSPFEAESVDLEQYVQQIQGTPFVTESSAVTVIRNPQGEYMLRAGEGNPWIAYRDKL